MIEKIIKTIKDFCGYTTWHFKDDTIDQKTIDALIGKDDKETKENNTKE